MGDFLVSKLFNFYKVCDDINILVMFDSLIIVLKSLELLGDSLFLIMFYCRSTPPVQEEVYIVL